MDCKLSFKPQHGEAHERVDPQTLLAHDISTLKPMRMVYSTRKQPHTQGFFWMCSSNQLVYHESYLERCVLTQLDFEKKPAFVLSQPFTMHWESRSHTPDFLVKVNDSYIVIDVKLKSKLNQKKFVEARKLTTELSKNFGFDYRVYSESAPVYFANLEWLVGFRRKPANLEQHIEEIIERVTSAAHTPTLRAILSHFLEPRLIRPIVFYLLWNRLLRTEMNTLFGDEMVISAPAPAGAS
jgi:hypothetical protein